MTEQTDAAEVGLDIEGVLAGHEPEHITGHWCSCSGYRLDEPWTVHVAAAVLAEVRAWLEKEAERTGPGSVRWRIDHYGPLDAGPFQYSRYESPAHAALAALAEQVGQVAPSRVPGEET